MVLFLRPRIGKENIHTPRMMFRKKIMKSIESLEAKNLCVLDALALALAGKKPHARKHPLYAEKVAIGILRRATREKPPFPAAYFNFQRP